MTRTPPTDRIAAPRAGGRRPGLLRVPATVAVAMVLALVLASCSDGAIDAGPVGTGDAPAAAPDDPDDTPDDVDGTTDDPVGSDDTSDAPTDPEPEPAPDPGPDDADEPSQDPDPGDDPSDAPSDDLSDDDADPEPTTDADGTDDADDAGDERTPVRLYFVAPGGGTPARADPFLVSVQREIASTPGVAAAALEELVAGPSAADEALIDGIGSSVPAETLVLGIAVHDRVATVDLSREYESGGGSLSMFSRLAQVVYTVTQFPTIDEVRFHLDGRPVTVFSGEGIEMDGPVAREDLVDLLPTVFVDRPAAGAEVSHPLRVTGMGAVFEATFQYRLETADGDVLAEGYAMTDDGVGWGSFDITIDAEVDERTDATLTVYEYSAKDGSIQAERATPLVLVP